MNWSQTLLNRRMLDGLTKFDQVESDYIEPGLLAAFRLFVGFQIIVVCIALAITAVIRPELELYRIGPPTLGWMVSLFIYLSWPALHRRLGKFYLPLALFIASTAPIVQRIGLFYGQNQLETPFTPVDIASSGWRQLVVLLVPLVFIAWQYNFRSVLYFSAGTFALNILLAIWLLGLNNDQWVEIVDLSLSGAISFALIGYIITKLVDAQREKQQVLAEANAKLVDHAATVEQLAISHERNRLARDLHDTLAHTLSAVTVQLEAVDSAWEHSPEQAHELLGKSLANARSGLAETRRALRALRASPLDDLGLVLALRTLAESTAARNGLKLDLKVPDMLNLPHEMEQNIYRIAQEAVTNAARHAEACTLFVILGRTPDEITLEIRDDGKGFDQDQWERSGHYGIQGMRERAKLIGADLSVQSEAGVGTTVRLQIGTRGGVQE